MEVSKGSRTKGGLLIVILTVDHIDCQYDADIADTRLHMITHTFDIIINNERINSLILDDQLSSSSI